MVISDVLFEAVKEIREYQNNGTGMYDSDKENIDKLCDVMDEFRQREGYDTPPGMPTGQPGDEDVRIGGVVDELDDRRSTVDRITWNALLDGMDMDDQISLTKELESWAGGNACDAIEYTPDSVGRLASESSPSPANNG